MTHLRRMALLIVAWGALISVAHAQDTHRKAALALHEALTPSDSTTTIQLVASSLVAQDPTLRKHKAIVERWLADQIASQAYADAKIAAYMQVYSEEELSQILAMLSLPAFKAFQAKHQETLRLSAPRLLQLARENVPDLDRRIQAAERPLK
jgi:Flp pilus assembly protein CpaB